MGRLSNGLVRLGSERRHHGWRAAGRLAWRELHRLLRIFPSASSPPHTDPSAASAIRGEPSGSRSSRGRGSRDKARSQARQNAAGKRRSLPTLAEWLDAYRTLEPPHPGSVRFSVVCSAYETPPLLLEECVQSVLDQTYWAWELVLVDDGSTNAASRAVMDELAARDDRIRVVRLATNRGISGASNAGAEAASGDYLVFLDHDDVLAPTALAWLSTCAPAADLIYTDEDKVDLSGKHYHAFFKPDWSPRLLLGVNYVNHLMSIRTKVFLEMGGFRTGIDGVQDHDLLLRVAERPVTVAHIPNLLYAWRDWEGATSGDSERRSRIEKSGLTMIADAIGRRGMNAHAVRPTDTPFRYRVVFDSEPEPPLIKIVMPTRDRASMLRTAVDGVLNRTDGVRTHLVIVDNGSRQPDALDLLAELAAHPDVTVHTTDQPFNFSRLCNQGVAIGPESPLVLLLNNDIEIHHRSWLLQLSGWLRDPEVMGAGPLLLYPDGKIQHAGVILGFGLKQTAGHYARNQPNRPRPISLHDQAREVSCLTAACLLVRAADYHTVGGMNEDFPVDFGDVDFCLRLAHATGGTFMYDPTYPLVHLESATRKGIDAETATTVARLHSLWGFKLSGRNDPFYNPHLNYQRGRVVPDHIPDDLEARFARLSPHFTTPHRD